ncbi:hypothetical protein SDC9_202996 [bioreactor metagenome]|uniref:Uncharacterized protein n=1 Tax=bioreactor metagenome TaxID=1076179 RepID=A0A645J494_9ZZZZ
MDPTLYRFYKNQTCSSIRRSCLRKPDPLTKKRNVGEQDDVGIAFRERRCAVGPDERTAVKRPRNRRRACCLDRKNRVCRAIRNVRERDSFRSCIRDAEREVLCVLSCEVTRESVAVFGDAIHILKIRCRTDKVALPSDIARRNRIVICRAGDRRQNCTV